MTFACEANVGLKAEWQVMLQVTMKSPDGLWAAITKSKIAAIYPPAKSLREYNVMCKFLKQKRSNLISSDMGKESLPYIITRGMLDNKVIEINLAWLVQCVAAVSWLKNMKALLSCCVFVFCRKFHRGCIIYICCAVVKVLLCQHSEKRHTAFVHADLKYEGMWT